MAGQSINDRLTAARYSLAGQGLAKSVCKATTEEVIGPKKKHLDYLLHCTNEPNVSIPQLANLLIERSQMQSWVSVFKALITVHHLMCYGNERFTQYLASSNCNFNLGGFLDKTGATDQPQLSVSGYDMSTFIRRYAKYLNEKAISYRSVAFDFCKTKRGKDDGTLRSMPTETLLKTLPILQAQLDALLDFDCTASELNNGVINSAFMLLFRDLIRLFACYNDGIINLLEKYFEMNKKQARDALDCYKKFLIRMDRVSEFLKVAEAIGMDKSEIPDLKQAPSSLLDALEAHLASLEGKKVPPPSGGASSGVKLRSAVSVLTSTSSSFGLACSNGRIGESGGATAGGANGAGGTTGVDEVLKRAALADEEAMYEKLKEQGKNNPFLSSPGVEPASGPTGGVKGVSGVEGAAAPASSFAYGDANDVDLFGGGNQIKAPTTQAAQPSKASDDLLQLSNPFADMLSAAAPSTGGGAPPPMPPPVVHPHPHQVSANPLASLQHPQQPYTNGFSQSSGFVTDNNFEAVFGSTSNNVHYTSFDGFGDILKPEGGGGGVGGAAPLPPSGAAPLPHQAPSQPPKLISGDLDMSLSSLVENLNIKGPAQKPQWNSPKTQSKTGGTGWAPSMSSGPTAGYRPTQGPIGATPAPPQWQGAPAPVAQAGAFTQPQMGMMPGAAPLPLAMFPPPSQAPPTMGAQVTPSPFDPLAGL